MMLPSAPITTFATGLTRRPLAVRRDLSASIQIKPRARAVHYPTETPFFLQVKCKGELAFLPSRSFSIILCEAPAQSLEVNSHIFVTVVRSEISALAIPRREPHLNQQIPTFDARGSSSCREKKTVGRCRLPRALITKGSVLPSCPYVPCLVLLHHGCVLTSNIVCRWLPTCSLLLSSMRTC